MQPQQQRVSFGPNISMSFMVFPEGSTPVPSMANPPDIMNFVSRILPPVFGGQGFGAPNAAGMGVPFGMSYPDLLDHLMHQHQPRGTPPVAKDVLSNLPEITISQQEVDQKAECSVCKDSFNLEGEGHSCFPSHPIQRER
eukprot:TRINITY_DN12489_c0_g1_i1.p1 TRINITY_DN12489_c0_g1~~TRINITY_DN12489_c0_g1_i1.p1  ORF type:complete len:140 (-),score=11.94 TRINITY_DN12489_c0_g1_i1:8-427(-)